MLRPDALCANILIKRGRNQLPDERKYDVFFSPVWTFEKMFDFFGAQTQIFMLKQA